MATRLTDIVQVFKDKWTYGDVEFGYESDINKDHDRQYPSLIIEPPTSVIESVNDGRENYDFEVNFYNLYDTEAQGVVELQKRWDNLQDLANEWLDMVLKNYQDVTVQAYINESGINIERVKEVGNDRLVQLKISFTMSGFTKCFRPVSKYPSDIADLVIWLKADSGATFDIANKNVSVLADQSGNSNNVSQSTKSKQPLRYGYDGANDKTYLSFDGVSKHLVSSDLSPVGADFTILEVSKGDSVNSTIFSYDRGSSQISVKLSGSGRFSASIFDGVNAINVDSGKDNLNKNHIGVIKKSNQTVDLEYYDSTETLINSSTNSSFSGAIEYNQTNFSIGALFNQLSGLSSLFLNGNLHEVVVFNRVLTDTEITDVRMYLNNKYRIY